jgi:micrococcal nuclease
MRARILAIFLALGLAHGALAGPQVQCANPPRPPTLFLGTVTRVVDGDTLQVRLRNGPTERVRLIGIDTPEVHQGEKLERDARQSGRSRAEIQALGRRASEFTRRHLNWKEVGLEPDVRTRDRYQRLLAYVWQDKMLFNLLIVREGYAQVLTIPPNVRYADIFLTCQREARAAGRGLWGP